MTNDIYNSKSNSYLCLLISPPKVVSIQHSKPLHPKDLVSNSKDVNCPFLRMSLYQLQDHFYPKYALSHASPICQNNKKDCKYLPLNYLSQSSTAKCNNNESHHKPLHILDAVGQSLVLFLRKLKESYDMCNIFCYSGSLMICYHDQKKSPYQPKRSVFNYS